MKTLYDTIGLNYSSQRQPDPRIAKRINDALGDAEAVLNVGAGTGAYEPTNRQVTALEPSAEMISQRQENTTTLIQGFAEDLPFDNNSFDASMAILTIHHWSNQAKGMAELKRVTKGQTVFLTVDPVFETFWLADYFPALRGLDAKTMPSLKTFEHWFHTVEIFPVPIPHDCVDGFLASHWRRPAAYLNAQVRAATSPFHMIGDLTEGLSKLEADLKDGTWEKRYAPLLQLDALDCGYRLIVTNG